MPVLASKALAISSCFAILAGWTSVVQNLISAKLVLEIKNTRTDMFIIIFLNIFPSLFFVLPKISLYISVYYCYKSSSVINFSQQLMSS
jgi:hypothetical protein